MKISLAEAATLLGKSERQVKYLIAQGKVRATKVDGRWQIDDADLPRPAAATQAQAMRAEVARATLERAIAPQERGKFFSVTDLIAFRAGVELFQRVRGRPAAVALRAALEELARGCHAFEPAEKAGHFAAARRLTASAVTELHLEGDAEAAAIADELERALIPKLSGLCATFERRARRRRFEHFSARLSAGTG
ncbi:MAG: helix-turn-helix domain-containing protein [Nannocystis sp.]|nr:helix-turn-helix domain-containing protein [Nannocystis sp.]